MLVLIVLPKFPVTQDPIRNLRFLWYAGAIRMFFYEKSKNDISQYVFDGFLTHFIYF
jgi:hypothetical protein